MSFSESDFLRLLEARAREAAGPDILLGIGDDAALLDAEGRVISLTTDMALDGIDFRLEECGYRRAGRKAMAKNLSDIAAMGVEPWCCFVSVALPGGAGPGDGRELLEGLVGLAESFDCVVAGGDTKRSPGPLVLNVAVAGRSGTAPAVRRSGARAGDSLFVTGRLGGSMLGHHLSFTPRVLEGLLLNQRYRPSAMIDLSDGLAADLPRLCRASGVGAVLQAESIPVSPDAARAGRADGREGLLHALLDGEDYELLFALPPGRASELLADPDLGPLISRIGGCTDPGQGCRISREGLESPLPAGGFEHSFDAGDAGDKR
ncbi:MAG: thiamine-phosphate kinase [Planctomycetota bacterium]